MPKVIHTSRAVVVIALLTLAGCGPKETPLAQLEPDALWTRADTEFRAEEWDDAQAAFQAFVFNYPTHPRIQEARYMLALSYYEGEEYVTAAQEFARLADDYPQGPWADDSRYRTCLSYRELSPKPQLDQEYTRGAIDHCTSLVTFYPESDFVPEARTIVDDMRTKLARKVLESGDYYFRRNAFDSAIIYYEDVLEQYPNTSVAPQALLKIVRAYERIGYDEEAEEARQRLLRAYPGSAEAGLVRVNTAAAADSAISR